MTTIKVTQISFIQSTRSSAEAAATEAAALAPWESFGPANISAVAGPQAGPPEPVALRLANPCINHCWPHIYNQQEN